MRGEVYIKEMQEVFQVLSHKVKVLVHKWIFGINFYSCKVYTECVSCYFVNVFLRESGLGGMWKGKRWVMGKSRSLK